ncbi:MAG: hypothetical protein J2P15_21350 [Micromonosporaceae bacterium]|nr:hypothetical protein [Micromonosporaceae bacterium]
MHRRVPRLLLATATTAVTALATLLLTTGPAHAAPFLNASYPINGSTHIKATNSDLPLGPGTLAATLDLATGSVTGSVTLPPSTGSFTELGFIPVQATTEFVEAQPTTGTVDLNTGATQTESHITIRITSLKVAGLPVPVGDGCETKSPAVIDLASQPGFNVLNGGVVAGTYTIPDFHDCLLNTGIINLIIPGDGNTISLTLGPAVIG